MASFSRLVLLGVCLNGNYLWVVFMCISCLLSSNNIVWTMGDLEHVW